MTIVSRLKQVALAAFLVLAAAGWVSSFQAEKLVAFGANGKVEAEIVERSGTRYVDVARVIAAEEMVETQQVKNGLRLKTKTADVVLRHGETEIRSGRTRVKLSSALRLDGDRALIPVESAAEVARGLLRKPAMMRPGGRLILGDAADLVATDFLPGDTSQLVLNFKRPVNPSVHTEEGQVRLTFRNDPVVMYSKEVDYPDARMQRLEFSEEGGMAEIRVRGQGSLSAQFSDGNRKIVITAAPVAAANTQPNQPTAGEGASPTAEAPPTTAPGTSQSPGGGTAGITTAVVGIDAAHGGGDPGVRFSEKLLEKDVVAALAEEVRAELMSRGISSIMLRTADNGTSVEDRAETANAARTSFYVALHAGQVGTGVRVYSPLLPARKTSGLFTAWDSVQEAHVERSRRFGAAVLAESAERKLPARLLAATSEPIPHLAAAAVLVEVAPQQAGQDASLESGAYQQRIAQAIAQAVVAERAQK